MNYQGPCINVFRASLGFTALCRYLNSIRLFVRAEAWVQGFLRRLGQGWVLEGLAKPAVLWSPGPLVPWSLVPWFSGSLVSGPVISGPAVLWFLDLLVPWSPVHRFWFIGSVFSSVGPWSLVLWSAVPWSYLVCCLLSVSRY